MTMLWQDGFDLYNNASDLTMVYFSSNTSGFNTTAGRFGGGSWYTSAYGLTKTIPANAEVWSSFAINTWDTNAGDKFVATFNSVTGEEVSITYNPATGAWKAWRGNNNTVLGTATLYLTSNVWHWIDIRAKLGTTLGEVEVWVDDAQILTLTGQNTVYNAGQTQFTNVQVGDNHTGGALRMYIDDWIIYTPGTRVGDSRIDTLTPNSDAGTNQATPSTGSTHYGVVDEAQFNTSDYLTTASTSGNKEVFGHGALATAPAVIHAVAVKLVSQKSDAGAFALEPLVVSGGTEGDGASQTLTTSWGVQAAVFETDPHTSAAWAYAAVNSAYIGYKVP